HPVHYSADVGDRPVTIAQLADGAGWHTDVVLVNTTEDQMTGEARFFDQGSGSRPGSPIELGIGDGSTAASVVGYDIPPRSFQKITTAGTASVSEVPLTLNPGASSSTPGGGATQISGWASADTATPETRLNGLEILQYRQNGITQSEAAALGPRLRQSGGLFVEVTDKIRSFVAIANPHDQDAAVDVYLTDNARASTSPVSITFPAGGQDSQCVADPPISVAQWRAGQSVGRVDLYPTVPRFQNTTCACHRAAASRGEYDLSNFL